MESSVYNINQNEIKRIPIKVQTWQSLHELKKAGQSYDNLIAGMIKREKDFRDWQMVMEIDQSGEFEPFEAEQIMNGDLTEEE
ncbi:hypothetical protein Mhun_0301 [Methanospirillum hungatei JF-1]|jgi:predicted CopG family antitoxin|uniref:Antitoxin n=1 Tax=Methanospirillum hungatei JF-1 (strain ATCC 27890 / DSM 864 / NBRC 100397 / JF-1) TaxID=323259 RepID=Q2FQU5_METHJ|nr:hypothetical protein [Methanospirillum hungatei]ABD40072.1 hypothetical protein Mhun_0301 [Methanospirillum hungatei JF-1]